MSMSKAETDNNYALPYTMRRPRKAKPLGGDRKAWFYVSPDDIGVYIEGKDGGVSSCLLTREQLARALQIMKEQG